MSKKGLKNKINSLEENLEFKKRQFELLQNSKIIKKYISLKIEILKLQEQIINLTVLEQKKCSHQSLYFLYSVFNNIEKKEYWVCICLECNKIVTDKKEFFLQTKVIKKEVSNETFKSDVPFSKIKEDYKKEELENDPKVIVLFKGF